MKTLYVVITHIMTATIIQATILAMGIWYYDITTIEIIVYAAICSVLMLVDYLICERVLKNKTDFKALLHLVDLVFAVPGMLLVYQQIARKGIHSPKSILILMIVMLMIDAALAAERIVLIHNTRKTACKLN